jgi:hypothetical protein
MPALLACRCGPVAKNLKGKLQLRIEYAERTEDQQMCTCGIGHWPSTYRRSAFLSSRKNMMARRQIFHLKCPNKGKNRLF